MSGNLAGVREERVRQSAASSSRRRRRSTRLAPGLPPLHDGALSLRLLRRYALEFDQHSGRSKYRAREFIEYLALEAKARLARVPTGLVDHALAPKAEERDRGAVLPVATGHTQHSAPATDTPDGEAHPGGSVTSTDEGADRGPVQHLPARQRSAERGCNPDG